MNSLDLSNRCGIGLDNTVNQLGHNYERVFIDMDREERPVILAGAGKGQESWRELGRLTKEGSANPTQVMNVIRGTFPASLAWAFEQLPLAAQTVVWFHVV
ncbi:MAG: hypothetical protein LBT47_10405 [Deltaproteobacteria bacterium]|jgi:hypothetical protein|nr:hypothetical protein [Deltaproteobacteria bacterium]